MCRRYTLTIAKSTIEKRFGGRFYIAQGSSSRRSTNPPLGTREKTGPRKDRLIASFQFSVTLGDVCCCHDINGCHSELFEQAPTLRRVPQRRRDGRDDDHHDDQIAHALLLNSRP
jgi:hypothetical protein